MSNLENVCEKASVTQMYHRRGLGAKPPANGQFFVIFEKKNYFNAFGSHFARGQSHLKELDF